MSETLYRKYRPTDLTDVKGQEHITRVLKRGVAGGSTAHAYLFAGTRGTGKTSVARILASMLGTTARDLYEPDAASNRGVDDVRTLREEVHTLPFESPYKVYIIDEAHMLTKEAFNALLKTIEEPPAHAIFILATTELEKLPETIVSRCEVHVLKSPTREVLRNHMVDVAQREGRTLEPGAADLVALVADGSFRDAHGVLQKILTAAGDTDISTDRAAEIIGAPSGGLVNRIVESLGTNTPENALQAIGSAQASGVSMKLLAELILHKLRAVLLIRFAPQLKADLARDYDATDIILLEKLAKEGTGINAARIVRFLDASAKINRASIPSLPLELAVVGDGRVR